jgi:hypothetical protein
MALIDGKHFSRIIQRYQCNPDILRQIREYIIGNYGTSENLEAGRCLVTLSDHNKRWLLPKRKDKYFDLVFTYWGISKYNLSRGKNDIQIEYGGAEEVSKDEFERRKESLPLAEVLRKAKEIINANIFD